MTATSKKTILRSDELSCPSCVRKIEGALSALDGVSRAQVFFNTGRIEVEHDADKVAPTRLVEVVAKVGYASKVSPL
ncbi:MAG: heavy-metal-associated domain-containing protein [Burkholderiaceae bacterium]|jgi:copper chaperone CopZ|nr:heavy-metal-associated domain-containing protein [Burkholderiaceae bacterium]MEB2351053.1 heavy-metal-associated domain-containing protein [Burkholderiaceae bacterium]